MAQDRLGWAWAEDGEHAIMFIMSTLIISSSSISVIMTYRHVYCTCCHMLPDYYHNIIIILFKLTIITILVKLTIITIIHIE